MTIINFEQEQEMGIVNASSIIDKINEGSCDEKLQTLYVDKDRLAYEKARYMETLNQYMTYFGDSEVEIYSAPGRTEVGGNHTDHQHGEVLAASINRDAMAVVSRLDEPVVKLISDNYGDLITIYLDDLEKKNKEEGTTHALIRGILSKTKQNGYKIGGFCAFVTSDVLVGAGLSSSAAFETLIGTILSYMYNDGSISAEEIAMIGQYAENVYFGKPCGLMDQMACSVGSLVHIDFADPQNARVERVDFDLDAYGYSLCITDTKGSHADLTPEYAAIPTEMKAAAACLERELLGDVTKEEVLKKLPEIRKAAGDRAALRALHYVNENDRVKKEVDALKRADVKDFLEVVRASGDSSFKYLQNVYSNMDVAHQNLSVALAVSDMILKKEGVSRVHGGGFAGTIQAFVPNHLVEAYKAEMENLFGAGACDVLKIRQFGGVRVI